ncbi:MAG: SUMF1/EgtB/PvdO family nonheme iron enzyme [Acidobacteriota bacterium]|nr:SUMF1/EgtB/PvdO family nonheme iron enzyme [Acidobacteriota bacterium]
MNDLSIDTATSPNPPRPLVGLIALVVLMGVAMWLSTQTPRESSGTTPTALGDEGLPAELSGFRANTWFLPDDDMLGFVEIPAGPFPMGAAPPTDPQAFENERWSAASPQGTVDLPTYLIGRHEVTVAQFQLFVATTGFDADPQAFRAPPDHPVAFVSWPDALAYCRWLDDTLRRSPDTPEALADALEKGWRITLPSESEWEKAARGSDGRVFPWGDRVRPDRANIQGATTTRVGTFPCPECPYGLLDMSGNVWEWTKSPYQPYPFDPTNDRDDLQADALWVMRGGSYTDPPRNLRATVRGGGDPGARRAIMGFRQAISPMTPP